MDLRRNFPYESPADMIRYHLVSLSKPGHHFSAVDAAKQMTDLDSLDGRQVVAVVAAAGEVR